MRILLVHNFYGSSAPSGENRVVEEERDLLRAAGHEVIEHFTHSDTIRDRGLLPVLRTAPFVPWNPAALQRARSAIRICDPDVMHVHNVFPLLSPAVFLAAANTRTAVVNTLHNYRTVCPAAMPMRNGVICTECIDERSTLSAMRYGCYRNSRLATVPLAASVSLNRTLRTYERVDAFIALTRFQKSIVAQGGLPEQRIYVKPNCYAAIPRRIAWREREEKAVFLGRISAEKGVGTLVRAWNKWGDAAPHLQVIGDGPELGRLRSSANSRIEFLGAKSPAEARDLLATAKLLVVPSTWFEGFPLVLCEAFAFGIPVAASRLGTFEELVETNGSGRLFTPGDAEDLLRAVREMWNGDDALERMSDAAGREYESRYSAPKSLAALEDIYRIAIDTKSRRLRSAGLQPEPQLLSKRV